MKLFGRKKETVPRGDAHALMYVHADPTDDRSDDFRYPGPTAESIHAMAVWVRKYGGNGGVDIDVEPRRAFIFIDGKRAYLAPGDVVHYASGAFTIERAS